MREYLYFSEKSELSTYSDLSVMHPQEEKKKKLHMDRRCFYTAEYHRNEARGKG